MVLLHFLADDSSYNSTHANNSPKIDIQLKSTSMDKKYVNKIQWLNLIR
jgi:hypothetical protein